MFTLRVKDQQIKVSSFSYLGSLIAEAARCVAEIKRRIALAKAAFQKLDNILRNCKMSYQRDFVC